MVGNGKHAARDVELFRPEMEQRLFRRRRALPRLPEKDAVLPPFSRTSTMPDAVNSEAGLQLAARSIF